MSGTSFLIARIAWQTRLSGLSASLPVFVAQAGIGVGKQREAGDVELGGALRLAHRLVDREPLDARHRGDRRRACCVPSTMNSGQIRSSVVSTFSRTMRRVHSDLRLRRMRVVSSSGAARASASTGRRRDFDRATVFDGHWRLLMLAPF